MTTGLSILLMEQLAGDLLPDANAETRIATGFLVLGAKVLAGLIGKADDGYNR